ncbi:MAG TPA: MBOAT family O-acyltransferase, partial [Leptospiraceae bacterium]|nr:MBOAT family O-acyltransferase [Leptospiraceae bacterium]
PVRIVHSGDSLMWADNVSSRLRRHLQSRYGDGGRGIVSIVNSPDSVVQDIRIEPTGFSLQKISGAFPQGVDSKLGFFSRSSQSIADPANVQFSFPDGSSPIHKARVVWSGNGTVNLASNGKTLDTATKVVEGACRLTVAETGAEGVHAITMQASGLPVIHAAIFESSSGVSYSALVTMGIHQAWVRTVSDENFICGWRAAAPDLVIFQFGLNESASIDTYYNGFSQSVYETDLRAYYTRLRKALPDAAVLIVGPLDRVKSADGGLVPVAAQTQVREVQRKIAREFGFAFYDTAVALGPSHVSEFMAKGFFLSDYMHLSVSGGNAVADAMIRDIFAGDSPPEKASTVVEKKSEDRTILFHSVRYAWYLGGVILMAGLLRRFVRLRMYVLMAASMYFYASWRLWALGLLVLTATVDYILARGIENKRLEDTESSRRWAGFLLFLSLSSNLGILFFFKYYNFFASSAVQAAGWFGLHADFPVLSLILPVGISFYTFQSLSYTIDVYRGVEPAEKSLPRLLFFVSFFPQLVAGPIVRARHFLLRLREDMRHLTPSMRQFQTGIFLIMKGLTKKLAADWIAVQMVDRVYQNPGMFTSAEILAAVYGYGLQIYGDFSGYTDIALGSARLLGYRLTVNFDRPYMSYSITDFWRRWHISLGSWFRDYLYIPLGGGRSHAGLNLFITMTIAGLWHGAGWNFVIWGTFYGAMLAFERATGLSKTSTANGWKMLRILITLHLVLFGWILFRVDSMETFRGVMGGLSRLEFRSPNLNWIQILVLCAGYGLHLVPVRWILRLRARYALLPVYAAATLCAIFLLIAGHLAVPQAVPFIYFQF